MTIIAISPTIVSNIILKMTKKNSFEYFEAGCDMQGDLFDLIGHLNLVNGQSLNERPFIDDAELAATRRILVHVQSHEGPVMKLYLWDQVAFDFRKKFMSSENTPSVILVTTVYPKCVGGTLALTSMASSRVFLDYDVQPTKEYIEKRWWSSGPSESSHTCLPEVASSILGDSRVVLCLSK
ncbi:hypothetical protein Rs2_18711 [Raphanus sativus]|nr:hypothetical protein Rs2_18711 [Raphanus sativus]